MNLEERYVYSTNGVLFLFYKKDIESVTEEHKEIMDDIATSSNTDAFYYVEVEDGVLILY